MDLRGSSSPARTPGINLAGSSILPSLSSASRRLNSATTETSSTVALRITGGMVAPPFPSSYPFSTHDGGERTLHGSCQLHSRHPRLPQTGDPLQGYYPAAGRATGLRGG